MDRVYEAISSVSTNVENYVRQWLHYQFLWDMQSSAIYTAMGTDVAVWQAMLVDVRKRRQTFDTSGEQILNFHWFILKRGILM